MKAIKKLSLAFLAFVLPFLASAAVYKETALPTGETFEDGVNTIDVIDSIFSDFKQNGQF